MQIKHGREVALACSAFLLPYERLGRSAWFLGRSARLRTVLHTDCRQTTLDRGSLSTPAWTSVHLKVRYN